MSNKILFYREADALYLIFFNHIMAAHISSLFEIIENDINNNIITKIYVDFYKCNYIDSTVIGTLIKIDSILKKSGNRLILYNLNNEIFDILKKMGLQRYFVISDEKIELKDIKKYRELEESSKRINPEFVLDAHNNIIRVSPEMRKEFEVLISMLKQEVNR